MNIALIGYGAMGRMVESLAAAKGHHIGVVVNEHHKGLPPQELAETLKMADAAIDFTAADAVPRNVEACMLAKIPLVEGTTGWNGEMEAVEQLVDEHEGALVFGANFSIGVNLFYKVAERAAELLSKFGAYEAFIEEQHHSRKKDAPSGTALRLKEIVAGHFSADLSVAATRAGNIPGTHRVGFDGPADQIVLVHTARSREGFASGAILAAEWIVGKKGIYEFAHIMDEMCEERL